MRKHAIHDFLDGHYPLDITAREKQMKVFIIDDSRACREGVSAMLAAIHGVEVICLSSTDGDAIEMVRRESPAAVILDSELGGFDCVEAIRSIKESSPSPAVIVLCNHPNPHFKKLERTFMQSGADHFLDKLLEMDRLPELMERVLKG